jgi:hypothetical protein
VTDEALAAWKSTLENLSQLEGDADDQGLFRPILLEMRADARQAWIDWWNDHADEINDPDLPAVLLGPWSKLRGYAARLVLIIHLLRLVCKETPYEANIDLDSMQRGLRLVAYFKSHLRVVYEKIRFRPEDTIDQVVLDWIRRKGEGKCTARDLVTYKVGGIGKASQATKVMRSLQDRELGEIVSRKAPNGRAVDYFVISKGEQWDERDNG